MTEKQEYSIDTIRNWESHDAKRVGFVLGGKANGRIASNSMSIVQKPTEENTGIVDFDDWMDKMAIEEEAMNSFHEAGLGEWLEIDNPDGEHRSKFTTSVDKQADLEGWLGVRLVLKSKNVNVSPLRDTFAYILSGAANKPLPTPEQAQDLSKMMPVRVRMSPEKIIDAFKTKRDANVERSKETMKKALAHIKGTTANFTHTPSDFSDVYDAALESSAPGAVKMADTIDEAFGNLALLGAMEGRS